jgi:4,5-dihydroxyphthalate decarboxylase
VKKLHISIACGHYDRTEALRTGDVRIDGADHTYIAIESPQDIFTRAVRHGAFDVAEMSMAYYVTRFARGNFPFRAIPVFPSRMFRHSYIFVNTDAGITSPRDLEGKRVGLWDYHHTAAVWIRGMLHDEHGVRPETITWLEGGVNAPRKHDPTMHLRSDKDISVSFVGEDKALGNMLAAGEIDALLGAVRPDAFGTSPKVSRLFPDVRATETDYVRRTGIFPIMHTLVVREPLHRAHPWLAESLFDAFERAKHWSRMRTSFPGTLRYMLPWLQDDLEEIEAVFGGDPWPYGIAANRATLETFVAYMVDQGFIEQAPSIDELFLPIAGRALG